MLQISETPPRDWDARVTAPCQMVGFARAMEALDYQPLFLWSGAGAALALARGAAGPLRRLTSRANLFAPTADPAFVSEALETLAGWGLPYVKVGDTMWGVPWCGLPETGRFRQTRVLDRHTFVLDLRRGERELLEQMAGSERKIRKAEREGVIVTEASSPGDIDAFCRLSAQTSARVRARTAYTDFPPSFFHAMHRELGAGGVARFYIGWHGGEPLATCLFLCSPTTMLYYLGGSTRHRDLTAKQAPAAVFWHAIRHARRLGMTRFDLGGCTPTSDPEDPRYGVYAFKKRWGGRLETFYNLHVVLSPAAFRLQERVLAPAWDWLHPLYFRLTSPRRGHQPDVPR